MTVLVQVIIDWIRKRKKRKECFHHSLPTREYISGTGGEFVSMPPESWIQSQLIDTGKRKMFWCTQCGRTWISRKV